MYERGLNSNERGNKNYLFLQSCCISLALFLWIVPGASLTTIFSACNSTGLSPVECNKTHKDLFHGAVQLAIDHAHSTLSMAQNLTLSHARSFSTTVSIPSGMHDCLELLGISLDQLNSVLDPNTKPSNHDIQTWLSAALTNQDTCSESLQTDRNSPEKDSMNAQVQTLSELISKTLALHVSEIPKNLPDSAAGHHHHRRLLLSPDFPSWLSHSDRKLLEASPEDIKAHAVVSQDGNGTHKTINEAIAFVSLAGGGVGGRSVIYITAGTYKENINIPTKRKNVMLMGDGKGKTVIVGGRNSEDGWTTYQTATVAAMGDGFIGKGLTIINNAGPSKHQAVALRVGADRSVITQCSIEGYQDTLYTHSNRQFYRDNDIYGTVDFIFGNSAVVFQNCFIQPRRPNGDQRNSITAQGRKDPHQNTGISIHNCIIKGAGDLGGIPTYLGRPWQRYSTTVFIGTSMDGCIDKAGWEEWSGSFALSTLYYGEYENTGPGASVSGRVSWPGVHKAMSLSEATKFTVSQFIFGDYWLPDTGVVYKPGI